MTEHEASRTLVKSPPELWAECSSAEALARHLNGSFGQIRITRLEPETAVAWEGELASGTVRLEPSGWGTKVIITARPEEAAAPEPPGAVEPVAVEPVAVEPEPRVQPDPEPEPVAVVEPEPESAPEDEPARLGFFVRMRAFFGGGAAGAAEQEAIAEPAPEPEAVAAPEPEPVAVVEPEPGRVSEPEPEPLTEAEASVDHGAILTAALDSLGQAHHRPFSRP